jgi:hypothetical protein
MKIRNINDNFGEAIEFCGADETEAKIAMAQAIIACGNEISLGLTTDEMVDQLRDGVDYEVLDD